LVKAKFGSSSARARQPVFGEISSRFAYPPKPRRRWEFSKAKSGLFLSVQTVTKIAEALGVPMEELVK
jgi:hypothetical protein